MDLYQVIRNEYSSDDGHYDASPLDDKVYVEEGYAIRLRDILNAQSVIEHNRQIEKYAPDSWTDPWRRGRTLNREGYIRAHQFQGDPHDVEAIERYADRSNALTYYTVRKLTLVDTAGV